MVPSVVELRKSGQFKRGACSPTPAVVIGGDEDAAARFLQSGTSIEYFMNRKEHRPFGASSVTPTLERKQSAAARGFSQTLNDFNLKTNQVSQPISAR